MKRSSFLIGNQTIHCYFNTPFASVDELVPASQCIFITDENIFSAHPDAFFNRQTIVLKPDASIKQQSTIDDVIGQLIQRKADRDTWLIGVGGGVITDITGYVAGIFMRGLRTGLVPTSLLGMVDAAIGGKNGIDVGPYKNLIGLVKQPEWILFDLHWLTTLPKQEWSNGFAEIIKHACIQDAELFESLRQQSIEAYQNQPSQLAELIEKNVRLKFSIVAKDPMEQKERRLLNFGHTIGHAIEHTYHFSHGEAISIGMIYATKLSIAMSGLTEEAAALLEKTLIQYKLPAQANIEWEKIEPLIQLDKKKKGNGIRFILLEAIGKGNIQEISLETLQRILF